jgi:hypothetical protein
MNVPILWLSTVISKGGRGSTEYGAAQDLSADPRLSFVLSWLGGTESQKSEQSSSSQHTATVMQEIMTGGTPASFRLDPLPCQVRVLLPSQRHRETFFHPFFFALPTLPLTLFAARQKMFNAQNQQLTVSDLSVNKGGVTADASSQQIQQPANISEKDRERDRHYFREQRLFFRAALGQLFKEKRFASLSRPVEPDQVSVLCLMGCGQRRPFRASNRRLPSCLILQVLDYYDVVLSPMDLETMRAKVDEHLYPTYDHFIYDIEQILYNAKLYNPTDGSSRGKSIVSAANQMLDAVESHAFHNIQIMKYNVFKKCEDAYYQRYYIPPPPPEVISQSREDDATSRLNTRRRSPRNTSTSTPTSQQAPSLSKKKAKVVYDSRGSNEVSDINYLKQHRDQMPSENFSFYEHTLERHRELAAELEEEARLDRQEAMREGEEEEERSATHEEEEEEVEEEVEEVVVKSGEGEGEEGGSAESGSHDTKEEKEEGGEGGEGISSSGPRHVRQVVDLSLCPLMAALRVAGAEARRLEQAGLFLHLLQHCVARTEGWSVSRLIALYSSKSVKYSYTLV